MEAVLAEIGERVRDCTARGTALRIRAGGTKDFYGNLPRGELLDPRPWQGILAYEPSELVITARCGTPLGQIEAALAAEGQMLAFEPPHFGPDATLGGCIAAGLAGPRRAAAGYTGGGLRDFVLGARLLDGRGRLLNFGGTVIKNVAGYDVARVLAGSLGTLGLIVDVSLKVLPLPRAQLTLRFEYQETAALDVLNAWYGRPLPLSATAWHDGVLNVRLEGSVAGVEAAARALGGERVDPAIATACWQALREQRDPYFTGELPLWRLALPSSAAPVALPGQQLIEWGGSQRWLRTAQSAAVVRARAGELGGYATLFRGGDRSQGIFTPLAPAIAAIHARLKAEFDPASIFNPGRLVPDL